jgi:hypothetical protein
VRRHQDGDVPCKFHLTIDTGISIRSSPSRNTQPQRSAGSDPAVFGGRRPVEARTGKLFVDQEDPTDKRMLYELWFTDDQGRQRTLAGQGDHRRSGSTSGPTTTRCTRSSTAWIGRRWTNGLSSQ